MYLSANTKLMLLNKKRRQLKKFCSFISLFIIPCVSYICSYINVCVLVIYVIIAMLDLFLLHCKTSIKIILRVFSKRIPILSLRDSSKGVVFDFPNQKPMFFYYMSLYKYIQTYIEKHTANT